MMSAAEQTSSTIPPTRCGDCRWSTASGSAVKLTVTVDNIFNYRPDYYYLNAPRTDGTNVMVGLSVDIDKLF